jgi:hypothetical protein
MAAPGVVGEDGVHDLVGDQPDVLLQREPVDEVRIKDKPLAVGGERVHFPLHFELEAQGERGEEGALGVLAQHQPAAGQADRLHGLLFGCLPLRGVLQTL